MLQVLLEHITSTSSQRLHYQATLQYSNEQRMPISVIILQYWDGQLTFHRYVADSPRLQLKDSLLNNLLELKLTVICICEELQAHSSQEACQPSRYPRGQTHSPTAMKKHPWLVFFFPFVIFGSFFFLQYESTHDNKSTKTQITCSVFSQ